MVLSRNQILKKLKQEELLITPLLDPDLQVQNGSIDLRLGSEFIAQGYGRVEVLDPVRLSRLSLSGEDYHQFVHVPLGAPLVLQPNETILGATLEYIVLPPNLIGLIAARSSWGRLNLSIASGLVVNPGNKSCLSLELSNNGRMPIRLYPGMRIGRIVLFELRQSKDVPSRYDFAIGPQLSRLERDPEMRFLGEHTELVIGVTGQINAGKSFVAQHLVSRLGFVLMRPSMLVTREFERRYHSFSPGEEPARTSDEKYAIKLDLRKKHGNNFLARRILQEGLKVNPSGIVIDGLEHPAEVEYLRSLPAFHLVAVTAANDWRHKQYNLINSGGRTLSIGKFMEMDRIHRKGLNLAGNPDNHADQLDKCIEMADHSIMSSNDLALVEKQIEDLVDLLQPSMARSLISL